MVGNCGLFRWSGIRSIWKEESLTLLKSFAASRTGKWEICTKRRSFCFCFKDRRNNSMFADRNDPVEKKILT